MAVPSLQDGIDEAGSPVRLLWKPASAPWGEHPGPGTAPEASLDFPRIGATVAPAPYSEHARTAYPVAG